MRSRLEVKVAKYSLLAIFMLLALSAIVVYFGRSNNNRERKQISLLDPLNLQVDESSCEQSREALADVLRYVTETLIQETVRQHNVHQYEIDMTIACIHGNGLVQLISDEHNIDCAEKLHKILPKMSLNYQTISQKQTFENIGGAINGLNNVLPHCVNCDDVAVYVMCAPIPEAHPDDGK